MDWLKALRAAIDYMEAHMTDPIGPLDVAQAVHVSTFYLQKGFQIITGYSLTEYIRNRRLSMAAMDLLAGEKVIDVAYKYCYQTPESFTKAFARFHGFPPSQVKQRRMSVRPFLPLKIKITIQGGTHMDYIVEKEGTMTLIGFAENIPGERGYELVPKFWDRVMAEHLRPLCQGKAPETGLERAIDQCGIGTFGVCIDNEGAPGTFTYLVAGVYQGGPVPEGLVLREIPGATWVKFRAVGPLPGALQTLNTQIFQEWLPGNSDYDLAFPINLEVYGPGDTSGPEYESYIWLPVIKKGESYDI